MKSICYKIWTFSWYLDFQEFLDISQKFSRNFTSRSRSRSFFISLSLLDLEFQSFSFHFHFSISISSHFFSLALLEKSKWHFFFTFHFSTVQNPLSQGTAILTSTYINLTITSIDIVLTFRNMVNIVAYAAMSGGNYFFALLVIFFGQVIISLLS